MDLDTCHWITHDSPMKSKYDSNLSIVGWVHSHVLGWKCNFSSIDVHTQFTVSKTYPDIFGMVLELDRNDGTLKSYDYFGLTRQGNANLEKCKNLGSECGKCNKKSYYTSLMHLVNDKFEGPEPLKIHDFTTETCFPMEIEDQPQR